MGGTVLAAAASGICEQVIGDGGDPDAVLATSGFVADQLGDSRRPVELKRYVALIEKAAENTRNDNFGLNYGHQFTPDRLGLIGMIAIASPTLGVALDNLATFFPLHQQATETRFIERGGYCRLEYRILDSSIVDRRHDAELTLGMFANVIRHCLGSRWAPEEVYCEHPRPLDWRRHEQLFDAPVHFASRTNALALSVENLSRSMPLADLPRLAELKEDLRKIAAGRSGGITLIDQVRSEIRSALPQGGASIETVADALSTPRWTLQRKLDHHGTSFSQLVDDVRRQLAPRYLSQPWMPATDVAFLLGYSELSALSRAFRRWYGTSPQQWRKVSGRP